MTLLAKNTSNRYYDVLYRRIRGCLRGRFGNLYWKYSPSRESSKSQLDVKCCYVDYDFVRRRTKECAIFVVLFKSLYTMHIVGEEKHQHPLRLWLIFKWLLTHFNCRQSSIAIKIGTSIKFFRGVDRELSLDCLSAWRWHGEGVNCECLQPTWNRESSFDFRWK